MVKGQRQHLSWHPTLLTSTPFRYDIYANTKLSLPQSATDSYQRKIQEITHVDPCHKFTWCLDACIREKNVDVKRSRELQGFLDSIKRGNEQVLGDLSMTLCDPYAINFLATSALKIITYLISQEGYARENAVLVLLLRMLALGLQAWEMISTQVYKEPKLDAQLVTKFLPSLMSLMVDDQIRAINGKLPQDDRESAITTIEHFGPPPDAYQAYIQENGVASVLAMYYTLQNVVDVRHRVHSPPPSFPLFSLRWPRHL
ncbi:negative elongation factor B [Trichonephila clavipes]|nr:negative elongation factor B [Trichonephila clavipes]